MQTITDYVEEDKEPEYVWRADKIYLYSSAEEINDEEEFNDLVDEYVNNLKVKIEKAERFRRKILSDSFPDSYEKYFHSYLDNLIDNNTFFEYMNKKCVYNDDKYKNDPHYRRHLWREWNMDDNYCVETTASEGYYTPYTPRKELCCSCEKLLDFYRKENN